MGGCVSKGTVQEVQPETPQAPHHDVPSGYSSSPPQQTTSPAGNLMQQNMLSKSVHAGWQSDRAETTTTGTSDGDKGAGKQKDSGEGPVSSADVQEPKEAPVHLPKIPPNPVPQPQMEPGPVPFPDLVETLDVALPQWVCSRCAAPNLACLNAQSTLLGCRACNAQAPARTMVCRQCGVVLEWPTTSPPISQLVCVECGRSHDEFDNSMDQQREQAIFALPPHSSLGRREQSMLTADAISLIARTKRFAHHWRLRTAASKLQRLGASLHADGAAFEDTSFPHSEASILGASAPPIPGNPLSQVASAPWYRPWCLNSERAGAVTLFDPETGDPEAEHVGQGLLGDCWFLSALAVVASERPQLLRSLFPHQRSVSPYGAYIVRLCNRGMWHHITVDDSFPALPLPPSPSSAASTQSLPAFARGVWRGSEEAEEGTEVLWVPLVEKALAKLRGSFAALESGHTSDALSLLTGHPCCHLHLRPQLELGSVPGLGSGGGQRKVSALDSVQPFDSLASLWERIQVLQRAGGLMCADCVENAGIGAAADQEGEVGEEGGVRRVGIHQSAWDAANRHSYSVLAVLEAEGHRLLVMRNPWAAREAEESRWWKQKLVGGGGREGWEAAGVLERIAEGAGLEAGQLWEGGRFCAALEDVCALFDSLTVCVSPPGWFDSRVTFPVPFEWPSATVPCTVLMLRVPSDATGVVLSFAQLSPAAGPAATPASRSPAHGATMADLGLVVMRCLFGAAGEEPGRGEHERESAECRAVQFVSSTPRRTEASVIHITQLQRGCYFLVPLSFALRQGMEDAEQQFGSVRGELGAIGEDAEDDGAGGSAGRQMGSVSALSSVPVGLEVVEERGEVERTALIAHVKATGVASVLARPPHASADPEAPAPVPGSMLFTTQDAGYAAYAENRFGDTAVAYGVSAGEMSGVVSSKALRWADGGQFGGVLDVREELGPGEGCVLCMCAAQDEQSSVAASASQSEVPPCTDARQLDAADPGRASAFAWGGVGRTPAALLHARVEVGAAARAGRVRLAEGIESVSSEAELPKRAGEDGAAPWWRVRAPRGVKRVGVRVRQGATRRAASVAPFDLGVVVLKERGGAEGHGEEELTLVGHAERRVAWGVEAQVELEGEGGGVLRVVPVSFGGRGVVGVPVEVGVSAAGPVAVERESGGGMEREAVVALAKETGQAAAAGEGVRLYTAKGGAAGVLVLLENGMSGRRVRVWMRAQGVFNALVRGSEGGAGEAAEGLETEAVVKAGMGCVLIVSGGWGRAAERQWKLGKGVTLEDEVDGVGEEGSAVGGQEARAADAVTRDGALHAPFKLRS